MPTLYISTYDMLKSQQKISLTLQWRHSSIILSHNSIASFTPVLGKWHRSKRKNEMKISKTECQVTTLCYSMCTYSVPREQQQIADTNEQTLLFTLRYAFKRSMIKWALYTHADSENFNYWYYISLTSTITERMVQVSLRTSWQYP